MGIFSSKKKTYVSSVTYNLAGDEEDRVDFLKYNLIQASLMKKPVGPVVVDGYLTGQGIRMRHAYTTAQKTFSDGLPYSTRSFINNPDLTVLRDVLAAENPGTTVELLTTIVGTADFTFWVEAWIAEQFGYNHITKLFSRNPEGVEPDALVTYDMQHDGMVNVILTNSDGSTKVFQYRLSGVNYLDTYVHCVYQPYNQPQYFMYKLGSGKYPTLDAAYGSVNLGSPYYPCVPIRVDNVDYTAASRRQTQLFKTSKKYLKKTGIDLLEIAKQVNDNKDINEIDYCFVVFGVGLNTKTVSGKVYVWEFIKYLQTQSVYPQSAYDEWEAGGNVARGNPKTNVLKIYHPRLQKDRYNIELQWQYITTTVQNGTVKTGAKIGDIEISVGNIREFTFADMVMKVDVTRLFLRRQITANTYEQMEVGGFLHQNHIYNGHSVIVTAHDSLTKDDEEGFILPLNNQIMRAIGIKHATQLGYECSNLVFNCYQVVKKKWYQSGWFKVLLVIVAIVITVVTWGADGGASMSAAASYATAAAAALGATGLLLTYLAATIYVLGAMVISSILASGATALFGEEWGAVIGAIATMVVMNWGNTASAASAASTTSKTTLTASQLLQGTNVLGKAYGGYVQGQMAGIQEDMAQAQTDYEKQMKELEELTKALLNPNSNLIDIENYMESKNQILNERADTFLSRTLLTGSEIAAITNGMITNFTEIGLDLALN